ncbi:MAG: molybdopterin-synthase adenylyltransferase MoeB [Pseudomonadota bacterium]
MLTSEQRERYLRHILLREVGAQGQMALLQARVLVVGAGGLGSPILHYLAAAGVGTIGVADDDAVDLSNLQRQVIYRTRDVGRQKLDAAADAVAALNPDVNLIRHREKLTYSSVCKIINDYDLVIEGVDSFEARFDLNRAAMEAQKPLVSAAIGRFSGQLSVFKPFAGDLPCYRCLVPDVPPADSAVNCEEEGVLGPLAGVMGSLAAMEVIKELLGVGASSAGKLLIFDALTLKFRKLELPRDPSCKACSGLVRAGMKQSQK